MRLRLARRARLLAFLLVLPACSSGSAKSAQVPVIASSGAPQATTTSTTSSTTTTTTTAPPTPTTVPPGRHITEQAWIPFAMTSDVTLHYPSSRVEHVGFHESNDE